jgi:hypothetical protein
MVRMNQTGGIIPNYLSESTKALQRGQNKQKMQKKPLCSIPEDNTLVGYVS